ncbi:hypothetical protein LAG90_12040 [Marinilongibacter aquaticus]|uniref:hypothetical protein n=1 Tax=Marinilongibacter aquaticus TaxID=2975157 RepID=UPI0021BD5359|nr:hypothetical protein [Marinilongibacter aquaticus]UBM57548.1 hypothetical protein LAG90_12040 [Marinilongibacter aquaticus]
MLLYNLGSLSISQIDDAAAQFGVSREARWEVQNFDNFADALLNATRSKFIKQLDEGNFLQLQRHYLSLDENLKVAFEADFVDKLGTFGHFFELDPVRRVDSWETLIAHPLIRKDVATLTSASKILDNSGIANIISKTDLQTTVQKLAEKGVRCRTCTSGNPAYRYMDEILDDLEHGASKFGNEYTSVITGFKQGGNFTEGAMFVADAVRRYGDDFPPGTLFEFTEVTAGGVRRVDVRVGNTFYEFKSVASVPPSGFADQFVKDLNLGEVTQLDQLKWWFDGNKVSSLPKQQFLDALDNASVPQNIVDNLTAKFGGNSWDDIVDLIDNSFDDIFHVK